MSNSPRSIVQVSMNKDLKKQLDFITKHEGYDSNASTLRVLVRNKTEEIRRRQEIPNEETARSIREGWAEYKAGKLKSFSSVEELMADLNTEENEEEYSTDIKVQKKL